MTSNKTLLYYGALLHDVGKVLLRQGNDSTNHAVLGADFISREFASFDTELVEEQVRYHNADLLAKTTVLPDDSLAYITCFASGIVKGIDVEDDIRGNNVVAHQDAKLKSIFNRLNGHNNAQEIGHVPYEVIEQRLGQGLSDLDTSTGDVSTLLQLLESTISAIPASTSNEALLDISLYDYSKVTAAIAACTYDYLTELGELNYREALFNDDGSNQQSSKPMFLLYSCDMSGIQDFIYNISGSGALKQLRARSMYLELILEHIVDELLARLDLCRANLLYTGGGHAYLILPNTALARRTLNQFSKELRAWFVSQYRNDLYLAGAWTACSADDLVNAKGDGKDYRELYRRLSCGLSEAKASRYDIATIRELNFGAPARFDHTRECSECHRSDLLLSSDNKCPLCAALGLVSQSLVKKTLFVVERDDQPSGNQDVRTYLALPFGCRLRMCTEDEHRHMDSQVYRLYSKNGKASAQLRATQLLMGDYTADTKGEGLNAYASQSTTLDINKGIRRLGVIRADADDLGAAFVSGLPDCKASIFHTSALSRALSRFFKSDSNRILEQPGYQLQIIYSGGDDLFIVGNWSDTLHAAMDIRNAFVEYTGNGALTLSAGIGMFDEKHPIARMASETGELEDLAKAYVNKTTGKTKDAICLWSADNTYGWDEFLSNVEPKTRELVSLFAENEKGSAFVYRLLELLRSADNAGAAPRLAYLLARSFESNKQHGGEISRRLYALAQSPDGRRSLVTALEWYVYSIRKASES